VLPADPAASSSFQFSDHQVARLNLPAGVRNAIARIDPASELLHHAPAAYPVEQDLTPLQPVSLTTGVTAGRVEEQDRTRPVAEGGGLSEAPLEPRLLRRSSPQHDDQATGSCLQRALAPM